MVRKLAAFVLLLVIPLQVAANSMLSVQCAQAAAAYSAHDAGGAAQDDGDVGDKGTHHPFFCHQSVSAIPVIPTTSAAPDPPVFVFSVALLSTLFFPEQPHRPPFAS